MCGLCNYRTDTSLDPRPYIDVKVLWLRKTYIEPLFSYSVLDDNMFLALG